MTHGKRLFHEGFSLVEEVVKGGGEGMIGAGAAAALDPVFCFEFEKIAGQLAAMATEIAGEGEI